MSNGQGSEQHQLLRDLRDATKAAREASAELARRVAKAQEWDLGYRCAECGKRERDSGALCRRCAVKLLGAVTQAMIVNGDPGASVTLTECMRAIGELLDGAREVHVNDENGQRAYALRAPEEMREPWHGDYQGGGSDDDRTG